VDSTTGEGKQVSVYGATQKPKRAQTTMGLKFRDNRIPTVEEFADAVR
jgi:hypothetical protein